MSDKNQAAAFVRELVSAESCYPPLRELGEEWLAAVGTDHESDLFGAATNRNSICAAGHPIIKK